MPDIEIRIPQLGEGLQEARLVRFLKEPGDRVERDEPIYEMETDKAVMEIESPAAGILGAWTANVDDVLPIGAAIGRLVPDGVGPSALGSGQSAVGSGQSAVGSGQSAVGSGQSAVGSGQSAVGSGQVAEGSPESAAAPNDPTAQRPNDPTTPSLLDIRIPQLGEGLQEARIVRFLKAPGDTVARDEPIYEMETDKAVMEIESPAAGVLQEWSASIDDVMPIGAKIGSLRTEVPVDIGGDGTLLVSEAEIPEREQEAQKAQGSPEIVAPVGAALRNREIPPRTRAYAFKQGLTEGQLLALARQSGKKLLPEDIDRFVAQGAPAAPAAKKPGASDEVAFQDSPLPGRQRTFNFRLQRSAQMVIPATMEMTVNWSRIEAARTRLKADMGEKAPSQFVLFCWCVAQAARQHPRFLCALVNDTTLRQYEQLHLGIAVARPEDELLMARVPNATALSFEEFAAAATDAIRRARDGQDQTSDAMQISVTGMAGAGITLGIPVVVAPCAATVFIGAPYDEPFPLPGGGIGFRRVAKMVLTFDHRIANGVGGARFMSDIRKCVEETQ